MKKTVKVEIMRGGRMTHASIAIKVPTEERDWLISTSLMNAIKAKKADWMSNVDRVVKMPFIKSKAQAKRIVSAFETYIKNEEYLNEGLIDDRKYTRKKKKPIKRK